MVRRHHGDCITGRCHWGGQTSRDSEQAVTEGREYPEHCGCVRHRASVTARPYDRDHKTIHATALAWSKAKRSGAVVVEHD